MARLAERYLTGTIQMDLEPFRELTNIAVYENGRKLSQSERRAKRLSHAIDLELKHLRSDLLEEAYKYLGL